MAQPELAIQIGTKRPEIALFRADNCMAIATTYLSEQARLRETVHKAKYKRIIRVRVAQLAADALSGRE